MCPGPRDRPRRCLPVHRRPFMPATRTAFGRPRRAAGGWSASPLLSSHRATQRAPPPQAPNALPLASHATLALTSAAGPGRAVEADKQRPSALRAFVERSQRPSAFSPLLGAARRCIRRPRGLVPSRTRASRAGPGRRAKTCGVLATSRRRIWRRASRRPGRR